MLCSQVSLYLKWAARALGAFPLDLPLFCKCIVSNLMGEVRGFQWNRVKPHWIRHCSGSRNIYISTCTGLGKSTSILMILATMFALQQTEWTNSGNTIKVKGDISMNTPTLPQSNITRHIFLHSRTLRKQGKTCSTRIDLSI